VEEAPRDFERVVIGLDPATTSNEESDACGIVVAGSRERVDGTREDGSERRRLHAWVLEDATEVLSPDAWARRAVALYHEHHADCIVAETTMGGEAITALLQMVDPEVRVVAKGGNRGKKVRAEPVSALYEQGRVHHVGHFQNLEDEMCGVSKSRSPNSMDAMVYAVSDLVLGDEPMIWV
jgi:phage terminase large subunit-like protein